MLDSKLITLVAKDYIKKGYDVSMAISEAHDTVRMAIEDALHYEYIEKKIEPVKMSSCGKYPARGISRFKMSSGGFVGNRREKNLVNDLIAIMNKDGFVFNIDLMSYIRDCARGDDLLYFELDESYINKLEYINRKKVYTYIESEIDRVNSNLRKRDLDEYANILINENKQLNIPKREYKMVKRIPSGRRA